MRSIRRILILFVLSVLPLFLTRCEKDSPGEAITRSVHGELVLNGYAESGELEQFMDDVEKTREKVVIQNSSFYDSTRNKTIYTVTLEPKGGTVNNVSVIEYIPKQVAPKVSHILFYHYPSRIINPDPLIMWHFSELEEETELLYQVDGNPQVTGSTVVTSEYTPPDIGGSMTEFTESNSSHWFGGDDRREVAGESWEARNVGVGQSIIIDRDYLMETFSVWFGRPFDYSGSPKEHGHEVEVVMQFRNNVGSIISQTSKSISGSFEGGWVEFEYSPAQTVKNNTEYIFTWYLKEGLENNLFNGAKAYNYRPPDYMSYGYEYGTGYNSEFRAPHNDSYFDDWGNWMTHITGWDFCFKLGGSVL